ncbi:hypothetical protein QBC37DRAFT_475004 [Rhypophila decipiens]|uniref:RBR-type E3 ubiquitin transferase n=1 Tax=Rhypophila decipiens TaxID=261697 RepID=A0AAN6Y5E0_9PEZI|nr:hypothetical protein QBC37DRAFT_475004 [Rhypophila decipiens]
MDLSDLDPESRGLILELYFEDLQAVSSTGIGTGTDIGKGKGKVLDDETKSDFELALRFHQHELATAVQVAADDHFARSVDESPEGTQAPTTANAGPESLERWKRLEELGRTSLMLTKLPGNSIQCEDDDYDDDDLPKAESSSWGASRNTADNKDPCMKICASCGDKNRFFDMVECPCSHSYCRDCIHHLYQTSLSDETLFPPRCCREPIPITRTLGFLEKETVKQYNAKLIEFGTPNRTYCHKGSCSAFVPRELVTDDVATCPDCASKTCTVCKAAAHPGSDCPADEGIQQVLELGRTEGWQRCYSCRNLVDLNLGCNHITCRCRAQFCYLCGERWKTCNCAQWQEERLVARANEIVDRNPEARVLPVPQRQQLVQAARQNLLDRHECDHPGRFRRLGGRHTCEMCGGSHKKYILECRRCGVLACQFCRNHRV